MVGGSGTVARRPGRIARPTAVREMMAHGMRSGERIMRRPGADAAPAPARPAPVAHELLALQRAAGNQAVAGLLRARDPQPERFPAKPADDLLGAGTTD